MRDMKLPIPAWALLCATLVAPFPVLAGGLEQLKTFLVTTTRASGTFTQAVVSRSGRKPQQSAGIFAFQRPGKFRWSYERPYKQLLVSDGRTLWSYDPELKQVAEKKLGNAFGASPAALLAGQELERHFELKEEANENGVDFVAATPRGEDKSFERVRIGLRDNLPVSMEIHDAFGQVSLLLFTRFESNPALPAGLFHFTPPAGADVVKD
ncbi:MAG: outer membrane lipoprotein carrier protein LolA [Betaproteobacteria bacterium HGW-Betaproteobacteria-11]|nr:MAG: outer membrane lipoprotein carrier protein LolA [Betaproteobacteria bacterium HGW-Betaproteobacteria-11]